MLIEEVLIAFGPGEPFSIGLIDPAWEHLKSIGQNGGLHPYRRIDDVQDYPGRIYKASGSYRECLATGSVSSRLVARGPAPVTRLPGSVPGTCFAGSRSSRSPPFAPPTPPPVARLCSLASLLRWQSQTSRVRASSASTPRLPDADQPSYFAGQTRDLPVPAHRASTHARVSDHAGLDRHLRCRARPCCLP